MWKLCDENIISNEDRASMAEFVLNTDQLTSGPVVNKFEQKWSEWQGCRYSVFVNSGSSANLLMVAAMRERLRGGSAVAQSVTWSTNLAPIIQLGFDLKLCDTDLTNLGPDLVSLEDLFSSGNCKFMMLTHLLGFNAVSDSLLELLERYDVVLLEDCCEAMGTKFGSKKAGNIGVASSFSFYFAHHFTTVEGGMVCTDDEELWKLFRLFRSHGLSRELQDPVKVGGVDPKFTFLVPGFNVRNTELYAHLGLRQMKKLDQIIAQRNENMAVFLGHLDPDLFVTNFNTEGLSSFALPIICHEERNKSIVESVLDRIQIEYRPLVSGSMFRQPMLDGLQAPRFDKNSEFLHRNALYVGNHAQVNPENVKHLCRELNRLHCSE